MSQCCAFENWISAPEFECYDHHVSTSRKWSLCIMCHRNQALTARNTAAYG